MSQWGSSSPRGAYQPVSPDSPRSNISSSPPSASIGVPRNAPDPVSTPKGVGTARFLRQCQGLATKQFTLLRRNRFQCCCQLIIPALMLMSLALTIFFDSFDVNDLDANNGAPLGDYSLPCSSDQDCLVLYPFFDWNGEMASNTSWAYHKVALGPSVSESSRPGIREFSEFAQESGWFVDNVAAEKWQPFTPWIAEGRGNSSEDMYTPSLGSISEGDLESTIAARTEEMEKLMNEVYECYDPDTMWDQDCVDEIRRRGLLVPESLWEISLVDLPARILEWTIWVNSGIPYQLFNWAAMIPNPGQSERCVELAFRNSPWNDAFSNCEQFTVINDVYTALLRHWTGNPRASIVGGQGSLPTSDGYTFEAGIASDVQFISSAPLIVEIAIPLIMFEVIQERQEGLRELMALNGLAQKAYWLSQFTWNVGWFYGVGVATWLTSYLLNLHAFQWASWPPLVITLMAGPAVVSFSYCCAQAFTSTRKALFFGYFWAVFVSGLVFVNLNFLVIPLESKSPFWVMMIPSYAFRRVLHLYVAYQDHSSRIPFSEGGPVPPDFYFGLMMMVFDTILYMCITLYADSVFKHGVGTGRHPLFPLFVVGERLGLVDDPQRLEALASAHASASDVEAGEFMEDPDAVTEREFVNSEQLPTDCPVVVKDLRKVYNAAGSAPAKVALAGMTLHMNADEVLCLLGPNGSGKTTLINVIVGVHAASGGSATVGGIDVSRDLEAVRSQLGVVAQFDVLFGDLSCMETCLFFCRIQGLSHFEESRVATHALKLVGLDRESHFLAKNLSGGMRRRLSIAIAICGKPKLIFMDEPTTGLDPETRRALWDIITNLKENRAICLTTHMMDEADALADRVAILSKGRLRAIGTAQHLKARFSNGYSVSISYHAGSRDLAHEFVLSLMPHAKIAAEYPGMVTYQVPAPVQVSKVFEAMEDERAAHGIRTWGINASTLEDVFLNVVTDADLDGAET